jgi:hypothetical protein
MFELEQQHLTAKVLHAYLTGRGYNATIEIGGGGILIVHAPILGGDSQISYRLLYAPYSEDEIILECYETGEWYERPEYPRHELTGGRADLQALDKWLYLHQITPALEITTAARL